MLRQCCAWRAQKSALRICRGNETPSGDRPMPEAHHLHTTSQ